MDKFANIKHVNSPLSNTNSTNSPNYNFDTQRSIVINKSHTEFQPKKLDFSSKFSNSNLITSQVFSNTTRNHMNQSTVNYMRSIYKGIPSLSQDRLKNISQNFMKLYGNNNQITMNGVKTIQREAQIKQFQQNQETAKDLFKVLDNNKDNRITKQDILSAARRYLNFQKKHIFYTPMVQQRLAVARRLFKQFDTQKKGYLTEKQVPKLLTQTYRCLNKTFQATQQDVRSWMRLADGDNDGYVTLPQYEQSIIRALKKQGLKIYED